MTVEARAPSPDTVHEHTTRCGGGGKLSLLPPEISKFAAFLTVARQAGPRLIEATIIPAVLFYGCLMAIGLVAAYVSALAWTFAAIGRRLVRNMAVPPLVMLSAIGITVRTFVAIISHSSFVYFFQPVLGTVAMGFVFFISVVVGRPIVGKLACEFWPMTPDVAARPGVLRLFRQLTLLWGVVNLVSAGLTMALLMTLPLEAFLPIKQVSGLALTATAIFLTISLSLTTARREGLAYAPSRQPAVLQAA